MPKRTSVQKEVLMQKIQRYAKNFGSTKYVKGSLRESPNSFSAGEVDVVHQNCDMALEDLVQFMDTIFPSEPW